MDPAQTALNSALQDLEAAAIVADEHFNESVSRAYKQAIASVESASSTDESVTLQGLSDDFKTA